MTNQLIARWTQPLRAWLLNRKLAKLTPCPFRTAQVMTFWNKHGCKSVLGHEIKVPMQSGRTATFKLTNIEYGFGDCDWQWHDYEFVNYD